MVRAGTSMGISKVRGGPGQAGDHLSSLMTSDDPLVISGEHVGQGVKERTATLLDRAWPFQDMQEKSTRNVFREMPLQRQQSPGKEGAQGIPHAQLLTCPPCPHGAAEHSEVVPRLCPSFVHGGSA